MLRQTVNHFDMLLNLTTLVFFFPLQYPVLWFRINNLKANYIQSDWLVLSYLHAFHVSILMLAFSSKQHSAQIQPHRAASITVGFQLDSYHFVNPLKKNFLTKFTFQKRKLHNLNLPTRNYAIPQRRSKDRKIPSCPGRVSVKFALHPIIDIQAVQG